jgi:AcrR family transcriptional regulator
LTRSKPKQQPALAVEPEGGRERILREALARFSAKGYAEVSMQEIADAVALTKPALYYHFGDKEGLFVEVFAVELGDVGAGIAAILAATPSLPERLARVARFLLETGRAELSQLLADLDRYVGEERRLALRDRVPLPFALMRPVFEEARAAGAIRDVDVDVTTSLYLGMVFGQIRRARYVPVEGIEPVMVAEAIAEMTLWGIDARR